MKPDVVIAGAGIIGASIAWRLAQSGARVVLVDAAALGSEASTAGAGMLAPGGEFAERSPWAALAIESARLYPAFVAELCEESGLPIDYRACGAVEYLEDEAAWQELLHRAAIQAATGIPSQRASGRSLFYPDDAVVDPVDVMRALREACQRRGVEIRENSPIRALRPEGSAVRAILENGAIEAGAAVLSAGAWSSAIQVRGVVLPTAFPVKGHLIGYDMQPGAIGPILRRGHTYLFQRSNGFVVAGTSSERVGFDRRIDPETARDIGRRAAALSPAPLPTQPARCWIGFRPGVDAPEPQVRRVEGSSLWLAYGHYRNGILLAPVTALRVASEISASLGTGSRARSGNR